MSDYNKVANKVKDLIDQGTITEEDVIDYINNHTPNLKVIDIWDDDSFMDGLLHGDSGDIG